MSRQSGRRLVSGSVVSTVCLVSILVASAPAQPPAPQETPKPPPPAGQSYTGTKGCVGCHRPESESWAKTKHPNAFTNLPAQYRNDPACLSCHVTGYGKAGGYATGTPVAITNDLLEVGCEACHGPGSEHARLAKAFAEATASDDKLEQQMRNAICKIRPDNPCIHCHATAFGHMQHPFYQGQVFRTSSASGASGAGCLASTMTIAAWSGVTVPQPAAPSGPRYTGTKPCASCHYQQYKLWRTDPHAASLIEMPAKYWADRECLQCHTTGYGAPGGYAQGTSPAVLTNLLNVTCEGCHGAGGAHVAFTRHFIDGPPLGPELEQMARRCISKVRLGSSCVACHPRETHQEHPKYESSAKSPSSTNSP